MFLKYNELPKRICSEFQIFSKENKNISNKLLYNFKCNNFKAKNNKNIEDRKKEKRKKFRRLVKKKYFLKDERLIYKYKFNNKIKEKLIPYVHEVNTIF